MEIKSNSHSRLPRFTFFYFITLIVILSIFLLYIILDPAGANVIFAFCVYLVFVVPMALSTSKINRKSADSIISSRRTLIFLTIISFIAAVLAFIAGTGILLLGFGLGGSGGAVSNTIFLLPVVYALPFVITFLISLLLSIFLPKSDISQVPNPDNNSTSVLS